MASYQDRQSFIPFRRQDIIEICLREGKLTPPEAEQFRSFAEIFTAYVHFDYQKTLENLKNNFAPIDPDADTRHFEPPSALVAGQMETSLIQDFTKTLKNANYKPLSEEDLKAAFQQDSLIPLKTDVDFNDFEDGRMLFYHRGLTRDTVVLRKFLKKKEFSFDVFERVVLLIKFKGTDHFKQKKKKQESQNFTPGKLYVYLYKKIPKYDLDILFPNVNISMTWKDLLRFGIPAISAIVPIILKALPNLILITGVILYFAIGPGAAEKWGATDETMKNLLPIITAILSLGFVVGSYAVKQYLNYKNKRLKFLKNVTDTLFFKNIDCNGGVLHRLVDEAEEEECKEVLLVYYFLLTRGEFTREKLDDEIEKWFEEKFQTSIDFNIDRVVERLQNIRGKVNGGREEASLLTIQSNGICRVLPLVVSKELIDYVWDNLFNYNKT